jgi:hypothetical protein
MADIQSAAISTDGTQAIQTTKVVSSVSGEKELQITFTNSTENAQNITLKLGAHRSTVPAAGGASEFSAPEFDSYADMQAYYRQIQTMVAGFRATSDVPGNFDGYLLFTEKQPDGSEMPVKRSLAKYKQPLGGGSYANEISVPERDLKFLFWGAMEVAFVALKPNSEITFYLSIKGWNKSTELTPLRLSNI